MLFIIAHFLYFCKVPYVVTHVSEWVNGTDIMKGVYYALVLTLQNSRKIQNPVKNKSNGRCPVGVLYTYPYYL